MNQVPPEPIQPAGEHPAHEHRSNHNRPVHHSHPSHSAQLHGAALVHPQTSSTTGPPSNVDGLVAAVQQEFPDAHIRVTGRGRTVQRQAELMAQRRRQNRGQFVRTYRPAPHITEMDTWVTNNPHATEAETTAAFVGIINRARQNGATVSNHLSDRARDVSIPVGDQATRNQIRERMRQLGAHVIDEHDAVGGPHWHVDF